MKIIRAAVIALGSLVALSTLPAEAMPITSAPSIASAQQEDVQRVQFGYGYDRPYGYRRPYGYARPYGYGYRRPFVSRGDGYGYRRGPYGYGSGRRFRGDDGYRRRYRYEY